MSEVGAFTIFCIELLKERLEITGAEAYDMLNDQGFDYIKMTYPALHTMSKDLIYDDLLTVVKVS
ncbi:hypothetical protein FACS1894104_5900 [Actinomycetota bacterium]|nr:hypothetical protein FACS1894104_5900 [Actinomycetota bacterium]